MALAIAVILAGCAGNELPKTPTQTTAGWRFDTPRSQGIPTAAVDSLIAALRKLDFVNAVVVAHDETIIGEAYGNGYGPARDHQLASVSKSILSALVGIAIREGYFKGTEQPLAELLPKQFAAIDDAQKQRITIADLLTMRQGLQSTDTDLTYFVWRAQDDRAAFSLDRAVTHAPGAIFDYNTGNAHLLSVAITEASGMPTRAFADKYLFGPASITVGRWDRDGAGYYLGGEDMFISARNLARFAALYASQGRYRGRQVIPAEWVALSTRPHVVPTPEKYFGGFRYGYFWWRRDVAGHQAIVARGWGGQTVYVLPALKLVIVANGNWWVLTDQADRQGREIRARIERFLEDLL